MTTGATESVRMPAIRVAGRVFEADAHWLAWHDAVAAGCVREVPAEVHLVPREFGLCEEGFTLAPTGRFVSRSEAYAIARQCGQVRRKGDDSPWLARELLSEQLTTVQASRLDTIRTRQLAAAS